MVASLTSKDKLTFKLKQYYHHSNYIFLLIIFFILCVTKCNPNNLIPQLLEGFLLPIRKKCLFQNLMKKVPFSIAVSEVL